MKVLVDTSVWSLAFRKGGPAAPPAVERLNTLLAEGEDVVSCGIILQEILQAFRNQATFERVRKAMEPFVLLEACREDHVDAARLHRACASKGITVGTVDCLIARLAMRHHCFLLTTDRDFERIAAVSDLKLE